MSTLVRWMVTFVGYLIGAKLGLLLAVHAGAVTPIWPPTGIALAALLLWGPRMATAIAAAAVTINFANEWGTHHPPRP